MYNVKILKYPNGWQYRVYSRVVGFCDTGLKNFEESELEEILMWNQEISDYEPVVVNPKNLWVNPFTDELETQPLKEIKERDTERSARVSMSRTINRVYHLARSNIWDWFITLTFDPARVDSFSYESCVKALVNWLHVVRRNCPSLKYIIVPEKHKSGRFHFHGLFAECEELEFRDSGHTTKDGQPIYNIGKYRLGWSTATVVRENDRVTKYISKYITKDLCAVSFGKKRYWASRNLTECPLEELIVEGADLPKFLADLKSKAKHIKVIESSSDLTTTYLEMGVL